MDKNVRVFWSPVLKLQLPDLHESIFEYIDNDGSRYIFLISFKARSIFWNRTNPFQDKFPLGFSQFLTIMSFDVFSELAASIDLNQFLFILCYAHTHCLVKFIVLMCIKTFQIPKGVLVLDEDRL